MGKKKKERSDAPVMTVLPDEVTKEWLQEAYNKAKAAVETGALQEFGIKLPPLKTKKGTYHSQGLPLAFAVGYEGQLFHQRLICHQLCEKFAPHLTDLQPRHLHEYGLDYRVNGKNSDVWLDGKLMPQGANGLASLTHPKASWLTSRAKRKGRLKKVEWKALQDDFPVWPNPHDYEHRCATCGKPVAEGEKGHRDPRRAVSKTNTLPQCSECQNKYDNHVVFGSDGRIIGLVDETLVKNSNDETKVLIANYLKAVGFC